jgi:hypothetical protein
VDLATSTDQSGASTQPLSSAGPKLLFVVDDTTNTERSGERFVRLLDGYPQPVFVHLLNVQRPTHGDVSAFVAEDALKDYRHEEGAKGLAAGVRASSSAASPVSKTSMLR